MTTPSPADPARQRDIRAIHAMRRELALADAFNAAVEKHPR
ncbi:MAG TPA: hypothetical protein PKZ97_12555 [Azospirillaceae bacterium]|nr:hypothetical protein [Azospirillaceae bacterium]HRQ81938.1 hypothetical protein [Azospirillaceae bacterium]